ncbi:hypothetical protein RCL1_001261 [Eukaryota sp. TZLM3-RCL]
MVDPTNILIVVKQKLDALQGSIGSFNLSSTYPTLVEHFEAIVSHIRDIEDLVGDQWTNLSYLNILPNIDNTEQLDSLLSTQIDLRSKSLIDEEVTNIKGSLEPGLTDNSSALHHHLEERILNFNYVLDDLRQQVMKTLEPLPKPTSLLKKQPRHMLLKKLDEFYSKTD